MGIGRKHRRKIVERQQEKLEKFGVAASGVASFVGSWIDRVLTPLRRACLGLRTISETTYRRVCRRSSSGRRFWRRREDDRLRVERR